LVSGFVRCPVLRRVVTARNGRVLGEVISESYFTSRSVNHFFKKFNGFGLSDDVVAELYELGVRYVVIEYHGRKGFERFTSRLGDWVREGVSWSDDSWGRSDDQLILSIDFMKKTKGKQE
jgi:hypothetical protein